MTNNHRKEQHMKPQIQNLFIALAILACVHSAKATTVFPIAISNATNSLGGVSAAF
ncbi:MAG: hypothetical protein ACREDS_05365 [Limisphaerales bacterium]